MKKKFKLLILILPIIFNSCITESDNQLDEIVNLYSGQFELGSGIDLNSSDGKINYTKLTISDNDLMESGWIQTEAVANNCAILIDKKSPNILNNGERIDIEIILTSSNITEKSLTYDYTNDKLSKIKKKYTQVDSIVNRFIDYVNISEYDICLEMMDDLKKVTNEEFISFLDMLKKTIPASYIDSKLIGYLIKNEDELGDNLIFCNAVMISDDEYQKMVNIIIVNKNDSLKIREFVF
ncbi:MAG: hypothetical protein K9H64_03770 [Bacteroidales bacterium]|nr:hypothetical protein [Bacteroidales bacterium]MCF8454951.1 hypothetical protein [Bacteroidales bacterium]